MSNSITLQKNPRSIAVTIVVLAMTLGNVIAIISGA